MNPLKFNKIKFDLAKDEFMNRFDIFEVATSDKYFKYGARIFDDFNGDEKVKSVAYESGRKFYLLMAHDKENTLNLKKLKTVVEGGDKVTVNCVGLTGIPRNIIAQLLLNALGSYNNKSLSFHNVCGHLYVAVPQRGTSQIVTMDMRISEDMVMTWNVRTFTRIDKLKKEGGKGLSYSQYALGKGSTLKLLPKESKEKGYVLKQLKGKKSNVTFMNLGSLEAFEKSKMGVLCSCLEAFNKKYAGLASIEFADVPRYEDLTLSKTVMDKMNAEIRKYATTKRFNIVDNISNDKSQTLCEVLARAIREQFQCAEVVVSESPVKDKLNILLIHDKEYYEKANENGDDKEEDKHDIKYEGMSIQHVTDESFTEGSELQIDKIIVDNLIQEAMIKDDIRVGHVSMADWSGFGYQGSLKFVARVNVEKDVIRYFMMTIGASGDFTFKTFMDDPTLNSEHEKLLEVYDAFENEEVVGIVADDKGNFNVITNTRLMTVPEISEIRDLLKNDDNKLRGKARREELLQSITDIKCFYEGGALCYFSGIVGDGMKRSVANAANIRKVRPYGDSELFFPSLLCLMAVTFVRNGQLTVMPFPFKYLREYIESLE